MKRAHVRLSLRAFLMLVLARAGVAYEPLHAQALPVWKATEVWRVDGSEGGEPFTDLRDYVVLKDNSLWALDFAEQTIRRYDANGKFLSKAGRKGGGPGEMQNANGMLVAPDGLVWVNDPSNARLSLFGADGKFVRQVLHTPHGYGYRWDGWFSRVNGEWLESSFGAKPRVWNRYNAAAQLLGTIPYTECPSGAPTAGYFTAETKAQGAMMNASYPFALGGGLAPDGNGNFWCAATRSTRVALMRAGTTDTVAATSLNIPDIAVTPDERKQEMERVQKQIARYKENNFDESKIARTKPGIAALHTDSDGRLWVEHGTTFGKPVTTFDVFDAKAKHLARVVLPVRQRTYLPVRARGNLLWLTVMDDDDVPMIVHYRLQQ